MPTDCKVRLAALADAPRLLELYAPFVVSADRNISDVSFEYEVPSQEEFRERIREISAAYPYLVCEKGKEILGYVYAHPYIRRAAYQWGAEVTIYLKPEAQGIGLGRALYAALEALLKLQGVITLYACITASNSRSVSMHAAMGYKTVGAFCDAGFKHGHWLDMVWMEKRIAARPRRPEPFKPIGLLPKGAVEKILEDATAEAELRVK